MSIHELKDFKLNELSVLIGANGAGKSNSINLLRLPNNTYEQQLPLYVHKQSGSDALLHFGRGTSERLHAKFYFFSNGDSFDLVPTADNRLIFESEHR